MTEAVIETQAVVPGQTRGSGSFFEIVKDALELGERGTAAVIASIRNMAAHFNRQPDGEYDLSQGETARVTYERIAVLLTHTAAKTHIHSLLRPAEVEVEVEGKLVKQVVGRTLKGDATSYTFTAAAA